jgi:hypothetical protein
VLKVLREAAGDETVAAAEIDEGGLGAAVVLEDEGVEEWWVRRTEGGVCGGGEG